MEKFTLSGAPHRRKARRHQETAQTAREGGDYWNSGEADAGRREEKAREASKIIFKSPGGGKDHVDRPGGPRRHVAQPGRQQGRRKGPFGQPGDSREAPGRQERTTWAFLLCGAPDKVNFSILQALPGLTLR